MTGLSRRQFLAAGGGLTVAGALSACGSPVVSSLTGAQPQTADVIYWHLFGGGDGANMATMVDQFQKSGTRSIESTLLSWGNPYYTKLSLSASSGRPPDVAIAHLSRLPLLAEAGLLEPIGDQFTEAGVTEDKFTPAAWEKATVGGTTYAVPLDTHPFVLFYNVAVAKKAGLLNEAGDNLKPIEGADQFLDAVKAMKDAAGGDFGAVASITADPSTCWRFFTMIYSGVAGPMVSDLGTKVTIDRGAMEETFAFMQELTQGQKLMPANSTATTSSTLFSQSRVGFLFDGVWQIPTYRDVEDLEFNVVPFPPLLGEKPAAYADSHALVLPTSSARSGTRTSDAVRFVKGLLDQSETWADGGHVPAWLPSQNSSEFKKMDPQSNYTEAAFNAVYDPAAWYTGAGSDFQVAMGSVIASVLTGGTDPKGGVENMTSSLEQFSTARPPV
ncbi:MAG: ABC transporter, substrate-binding protein (cluster 1, maltose/g3p/polyamine/iron) [uncultured Nocardioidaceae bacterium]|uniref:ABC transporter, substrate-binding protein (Cluster 1, maltose/g3p/polyamine/iron) n=1 Tax=uncultured Nocardioidaceae bacterium TaxID=253824 RepID=A0A6J4LA45_9ACTN|nr:MAG: ABC transporter, substrate-binding protein (cluster 1, maltose/g3p/polyamine/iron) [uncultured Nocardioidaceae bacterium]